MTLDISGHAMIGAEFILFSIDYGAYSRVASRHLNKGGERLDRKTDLDDLHGGVCRE